MLSLRGAFGAIVIEAFLQFVCRQETELQSEASEASLI